MPHTKSAKKSLRKSVKRRLHNRSVKKTIKTFCKRVLAAAAQGTPEEMKNELAQAAKRLDKAAAKRIIHPNLAARKKSQLARVVNQRLAAAAAAPPPQPT